MDTTYIIRDPDSGLFAAAIADLIRIHDSSDNDYVISRINVMEKYRGLGYGTKILNMILKDADREGVTLFLDLVPSGGLNGKELKAWYMRHGFIWDAYHMIRQPKS